MFIRVAVWTDKDAQDSNFDDLGATGYAEEITSEQIHLPVGNGDDDCETIAGEQFTGMVGSITGGRLYSNEATLIRAADGTVWIEWEEFEEAVM